MQLFGDSTARDMHSHDLSDHDDSLLDPLDVSGSMDTDSLGEFDYDILDDEDEDQEEEEEEEEEEEAGDGDDDDLPDYLDEEEEDDDY